MTELSDKEIVAACARVMGLLPYMNPPELTQHGMAVERLISGGVHSSSQQFFYNPLANRAQAMELVERLEMFICRRNAGFWETYALGYGISAFRKDLLRAICLCAARVQIEKEKNADG